MGQHTANFPDCDSGRLPEIMGNDSEDEFQENRMERLNLY